jgi:hypothetical protein
MTKSWLKVDTAKISLEKCAEEMMIWLGIFDLDPRYIDSQTGF